MNVCYLRSDYSFVIGTKSSGEFREEFRIVILSIFCFFSLFFGKVFFCYFVLSVKSRMKIDVCKKFFRALEKSKIEF